MSSSKLRQQIAWEAARLMYERQESEYYRAKLKAAKHLCQGWVKPADLPTNREIRDEIQSFARMFEGQTRVAGLCDMRVAALRMMRLLSEFRPRLIGSVLTGHTRQGSDIDLHVFADNVSTVAAALEREHFQFEVERKQVRKQGEERVFTHIHVDDRFRFELTVYATSLVNFPFTSSITGKTIERANIRELEELLAREYPDLSVDDAVIEPRTRSIVFKCIACCWHHLRQSNKAQSIIPRVTRSITACRYLTWRVMNCRTMKSFSWPRCCTMWAKRSIHTITWRRRSKRSKERSVSVLNG